MEWPERGVYFFFEPGEFHTVDPAAHRVTRVGTHALTEKSRTTLWKRLSQHRGTANPRGGNHRGSILRLLVGEALINRDKATSLESWGQKSSAPHQVRLAERPHEVAVSEYLGAMSLLFLPVADNPGVESARGLIERNSIALLSGFGSPSPDPPSCAWLGQFSGRDRVRRSGLWNNRHVDENYDPDFLPLLIDQIDRVSLA
ncbi:hypothetical protein [Hartmannibacter diazotrophicus]|nr:hypothetical protein [Hartmannibacter diazotrophicus]